MRNMVDSRGQPHGLTDVISNSVGDKNFMQFKEADRESMKKLKAKQAKLVKARYINSKGGTEHLSRAYMLWAGDPINYYKFIHNHVYEVPQGLIDDVNGQPAMPERSGLLDVHGQPTIKDKIGEKEHRFYPAEF